MVTELEYLNMMPTDLSRVDESSFLKGMQQQYSTEKRQVLTGGSNEHHQGVVISSQLASEQSDRINQLEDQLRQH